VGAPGLGRGRGDLGYLAPAGTRPSLAAQGRRQGRRRAGLRHRLLVGLAGPPWRRGRRPGQLMVPARDGAAAPTDARARHPARSRRRGASTAAQRQLRCRPVRVRRQHLVRPQRWIPEAARLLRPGGELVFLRYSVFLALCAPDGEGQADDRLVRDYFGLHRLEWSGDESMEFALPFGEWLRLFRATGFDVLDLIELRPPAGDPLPARDQHLGAPLAEPGDLALAEAAMIRSGRSCARPTTAGSASPSRRASATTWASTPSTSSTTCSPSPIRAATFWSRGPR
jgi:hypothetical protein